MLEGFVSGLQTKIPFFETEGRPAHRLYMYKPQ